jgi:hypothetical protein
MTQLITSFGMLKMCGSAIAGLVMQGFGEKRWWDDQSMKSRKEVMREGWAAYLYS